MRTLSALAFRRTFGAVLDDVARKHQPITITRANRALVVLVPAEDYETERSDSDAGPRERRLRRASDALAEWRRHHAGRLGGLDAVQLVREDRNRR